MYFDDSNFSTDGRGDLSAIGRLIVYSTELVPYMTSFLKRSGNMGSRVRSDQGMTRAEKVACCIIVERSIIVVVRELNAYGLIDVLLRFSIDFSIIWMEFWIPSTKSIDEKQSTIALRICF